MLNLISIIAVTAFVNNVVLIQLIGVPSFITNSNRLQSALELGMTSFIAIFISSVVNLFFHRWVLIPLNLVALRLILFVLISSIVAFYLVKLIQSSYPLTRRRYQLALCLIGGNSAVIGISLILSNDVMSIGMTLATSFGAALGFALILIGFAALRDRLRYADIPERFQGPPIYLISAAIITMILLGFEKLV
ncbi:MAG: hypothetical protein CMQ41_11605 [Gammaproteobacteria bacterium]|nr:hypothetical protein [Gammaproteobacteria bacterium]